MGERYSKNEDAAEVDSNQRAAQPQEEEINSAFSSS